jgi:hypothetical protein
MMNSGVVIDSLVESGIDMGDHAPTKLVVDRSRFISETEGIESGGLITMLDSGEVVSESAMWIRPQKARPTQNENKDENEDEIFHKTRLNKGKVRRSHKSRKK